MKSLIVHFKTDSELNSVSQNAPFFTSLIPGQSDRLSSDQTVKPAAASLFFLCSSCSYGNRVNVVDLHTVHNCKILPPSQLLWSICS